MGNKIELALWRGDLKSLQFYTDHCHEEYVQHYRRPGVFGAYAIHILVYVYHKYNQPLLLSNILFNMRGCEDMDVIFGGGITAMDLACNDHLLMCILWSMNCVLKARHFYRVDQSHAENPWIFGMLERHYQSFCEKDTLDALLRSLGPQNIHDLLYPGAPTFFTPLFVAVLANNQAVLKALISKGAKPNLQPHTSEGNYSLLHLAARLDHCSLISTLVEAGCCLHECATGEHRKSRTPLVIAAHYGNLRSIKALAESASFDIRSSSGDCALYAAAQEGQFHVIPMLVKLGCKVDYNLGGNQSLAMPIHAATRGNYVGALRVLLQQTGNLADASITCNGSTPLHVAARAGSSEVVPVLMHKGILPRESDDMVRNLESPYHIAVCKEELGVLKALISTEFYIPMKFLGSLLHFALDVRHLRAKGIHSTPSLPYNGRSTRFLEELVKVGCSIRTPSEDTGFLPIHVAALWNDSVAVQLFINLGFPPNAFTRSRKGRRGTPMHIAAQSNSTKVIEILAANGCNVDFHHPLEDPPLHVAICSGSVNSVSTLLRLGASTMLENRAGIQPLYSAIATNQAEIIEILVNSGVSISQFEFGYDSFVRCVAKSIQMEELVRNGALLNSDTMLPQLIPDSLATISPTHEKVLQVTLERLYPKPTDFVIPPLLFAVYCNKEAAIRKLVALGADVNEEFFETNPLFVACKKGSQKLAAVLIDIGADIEATAQSGLRPLHAAVLYNHPDVVLTLIEKGCCPTSQVMNCGQPDLTPFQLACIMCRPVVLRMLFETVPDIHEATYDQLSPLHLAILTPGVNFSSMRGGGDCNASIKIKPVCLEETVQVLLNFKCHVNAVDKEGVTPLDLAVHYNLERIVFLLTQAGGERGVKIKEKEGLRRRVEVLESRMRYLGANMNAMEYRLQDLQTKETQSTNSLNPLNSDLNAKIVESLLRKFNDVFIRDAGAKEVASELRRRRVIPQPVEIKIERTLNRKEANGHLYDHLFSQGTLETLQMVCDVFIKEEGYHRMNELGKMMKKEFHNLLEIL
jgi:ankyrin repeat protein